MGVTNRIKEEVCQRYSSYLRLIYCFGNKVMLRKQLFEYAKFFGLANDYHDFHLQIKELVYADILRQEFFVALGRSTQLHVLVLRKYAIRFIEAKQKSYEVSAVPKSNSNERILLSLFKNAFILQIIIPRFITTGRDLTFDNLFDYICSLGSNILYKKNESIYYLDNLLKKPDLSPFVKVNELKHIIWNLEERREKQLRGLWKGAKMGRGKGKGKDLIVNEEEIRQNLLRYQYHRNRGSIDVMDIVSKKDKKIINYSIDNMFGVHAYIVRLFRDGTQNRIRISVCFFDLNNSQDIHKFTSNIACMYQMFVRYFNIPVFLHVGIFALDEEAKNNIVTKMEEKVKDFFTKEEKKTKMDATLENWGINAFMRTHLKISVSHLDLTNRYFDGVKYNNLLKG